MSSTRFVADVGRGFGGGARRSSFIRPSLASCFAFAGSLVFCVCCVACGTTIRTQTVHPPEMPARIYPAIIVLHRGSRLEIDFAQNLAQHLSSTSDAQVRVMDPQQIAAAAPLPSSTIVVQIQIDSAESARLDYVPMYGTACGWYSCYTTASAMPVTVPTLMTRLVAQLRNGATAAVVMSQTADEAGDAVRGQAVLTALYRDLVTWIDGRREIVEYEIDRVKDDRVERAIGKMRRGQFAEARTSLEAVAASGEPARWKAKQRARFFYVLAIARRYDPTTQSNLEPHFAAAIAAADDAIRAHDEEAYRALRARLDSDLRDARSLAALNAEAARLRAAPSNAVPPTTVPAAPAH